MKRLLALTAVTMLVGGGCARSLRAPPSLETLAGEARHAQADVDRLLQQASELFAERNLDSVRRSRQLFFEAASADTARIQGWIGSSRAAVWLAIHEESDAARDAAARAAVESAQLCGTAAPGEPECAYWLALALGVQARERRSTAHDALPRIVDLLERVIAERPGLDHAGGHRVLGLLLLRAPGWPAGPGDADRALEHARAAVAREPDFPPNQLCLAEALAAVEEKRPSQRALELAESLARQRLASGDREAAEWLEEIEVARSRGWAR